MDDKTPNIKESNAGRPSKYKPEYCEDLIKYFSVKPIDPETEKISDFPTLAGFAIKLGVDRDTLKEWAKVHDEFSAAYKRASDFQENFLVTLGLRGLINTAFGIFTAKNVLKWRDKQEGESEVVINNITTLSDAEIEAKLKKLTSDKK